MGLCGEKMSVLNAIGACVIAFVGFNEDFIKRGGLCSSWWMCPSR